MVDDHNPRPYRSNEPPAYGGPAKSAQGPGQSSSSDPLAELARLIGQSDPFSEYGRDGVRRIAPPMPPEHAHDWDAQPTGAGYAPQPPSSTPEVPEPIFPRQQFGGAPLAGGADLYRDQNEYRDQNQVPGYEHDRFDSNNAHLGPEEQDFYDDEPPTRRRMGVLVIAGVFALAVVGTAGAFGYRALFGSSSSSLPPPVIKADSTPSKIVPAAKLDTQSNKQITDRVNDRGLGEKLVSREEQPVAVSPQSGDPSGSASAPLGSGVVGSESKKVRTIAIYPDQPFEAPVASPPPPAARATAAPPVKRAAPVPAPVPAPAPRVAAAEPEPAPTPAPPRQPQPVARTAPAAPSNAPLSLSPDATPARPAPAPRTASVAPAPVAAPPTASTGGSGYAVQVSSQRSEAEAQAAFRSLQGKYPGQLGGKQPVIARADLGDKGIYFRAMVPVATGGEATELCTSLKAAGGSCIIQRN
jgi:SPOR domain